MAATTKTGTCWVVCDSYAAGPYTTQAAERALARYDSSVCGAKHRVVASRTKPVTVSELQVMRADWEHYEPSGDGWWSTVEGRTQQTRELAAAILAAPLGTPVGDVKLTSGGWSKETANRADATALVATPEWYDTLGPREHATLTGDGRSALHEAWCQCPDPAGWVAYERWTAEGRIAHGFVHETCRRLIQTG
jgi:hypothetical protein